LGQAKPSVFTRFGAPRRLLTSRQGRTGAGAGLTHEEVEERRQTGQCEPRGSSLKAWYAHAVTHNLQEYPGSLMVLTACEVAQTFAPPRRAVGSIEVEAAAHALEQLERDGLLCRRTVKGELRYLND
jgi:hypothetical protein